MKRLAPQHGLVVGAILMLLGLLLEVKAHHPINIGLVAVGLTTLCVAAWIAGAPPTLEPPKPETTKPLET